MSTKYRCKKQVTRLMAGFSQFLAILMSMLRRSLEGAYKEAIRRLEGGYSEAKGCLKRYFRTGGQTPCAILVRCLRTASSQPTNCQFAAHGLFRILLLLLLTLGSGNVWGQTDFSGVWYIANDNTSSGHPGKVYSSATDAEKWYLVPAADPQQTPSCIDAYYSPNHATTNGDPEKPFLATYQTGKDLNSIWIIK